ncbi:MAG: hydrogenase maturation protease [bacterium]
MDKNPITVVGIGNAYRSDDGVGLYIAERIRSLALNGVKAVVGIGDGFALVDIWSDSTMVFVIDCASSGALSGTTYRFDALHEKIPSNLFSGLSTHSIAVNDAVELARVLNRLPGGLVVYGIEGSDFSPGNDLTPAVRESAHKVVDSIYKEIEVLTHI